MQDNPTLALNNDQELFELAKSIDPTILSFFRLLEHPYRGGPDYRYLYTTDQVQEAIIQTVQLTISRTSPVYLFGPYGTGKTSIISRLFTLLNVEEQFDVKLIVLHRGATKNWLIRKIAEEFGVKTARSYSQTLENVQAYLGTVDQSKIVPTLLVDDAHFMDDECLSTLYSLLNAEDNKVKFCQIVLAGQEQLADKIASLGELESRMRSIEIAPMTPDELKKMFQFRWQVAGGRAEEFPFDESDIESFNIIFRYSKGLPRSALKVADELLKHLVVKQAKKGTSVDVEHVAKNTLGRQNGKRSEEQK